MASCSPQYQVWDLPKVFWRIVLHCDDATLANLVCVNQRFHTLATHDNVWKEVLVRLNLQSLLSQPVGGKCLYRYFIEDILTTRVLHGRYEFEAAVSASDRLSPYNVSAATLIVSTATLGNCWHAMGRSQLMVTYRSGAVEVLQGCLRFSGVRKCFVMCSSVFGSPVRGPVFTIAIAQVKRKWANQSQANLQAHMGGVRLVMTPVLVEGKSKGSLITETDIIAVSRPPPPGLVLEAMSPSSPVAKSLDF